MVSSLLPSVRSETDLLGHVDVGSETSLVARDAFLDPEFQRAARRLERCLHVRDKLRAETDFNDAFSVAGLEPRPPCDGGADVRGGAAVAAPDGRAEPEFHGHDSVAGKEIALRPLHNSEARGSADRQAVGSSNSRMHVAWCYDSQIHESRSSSLACARSSSGMLHGARGVGLLGSAVSAARGSSCLLAARARSYADVAATACGEMAVRHEHARNSVVSGGLLLVCKSTSYNLEVSRQGPTATSTRNQVVQGRCGDTFHPPGGSWYPIRVTWTRIGHQAIDGLDEGV